MLKSLSKTQQTFLVAILILIAAIGIAEYQLYNNRQEALAMISKPDATNEDVNHAARIYYANRSVIGYLFGWESSMAQDYSNASDKHAYIRDYLANHNKGAKLGFSTSKAAEDCDNIKNNIRGLFRMMLDFWGDEYSEETKTRIIEGTDFVYIEHDNGLGLLVRDPESDPLYSVKEAILTESQRLQDCLSAQDSGQDYNFE